MSKEEQKKVYGVVSEDCWMKLKILAIKKKITLTEYLSSLLESHTKNKNIDEM